MSSSGSTQQTRAVRPATAADVTRLSEALARAYHDDPVWAWLLRDASRRSTALARYFAIELRHVILPYATAWTTSDLVGGALCTPPDRWRVPPSTMARQGPAFTRALGRELPRCFSALTQIERHHPREPHYYLAYLAAEPRCQGKGVGADLLEPLLTRCDSEQASAYLEGTSERVVPFYRRHGFEVTKRIELRNGPPLWLMWREPQPAS